MAQEMRNSPEIRGARERMKQELRDGCRAGLTIDFERSLGAEGKSKFYKGFWLDLAWRNRSRAFLGSFEGKASVIDCWGCCAVVEFTINNTAGWKSATRLPPPFGYDDPNADAVFGTWPPNFNPNRVCSILPDNCFGRFGRNVEICEKNMGRFLGSETSP
jgi:hypothetical protein